MNSSTNPIVFRFSTAADADAIVDFYKNDLRRTVNVFLRHESLIREQAEKGRFVTAWQGDELIAASTLYVLAQGNKIDCIDRGQNKIEFGRTVELGSVLRLGNDPNDTIVPKGFWHLMLLGIPIIAALRFDVDFDIMVTEILHTAGNTKKFVRGDEETGSPLCFELIGKVAQGLLDACGATTDDLHKQNGKDFFRVSVSKNIVPVALMLNTIISKGYIEDTRPADTIGYKSEMKVYVDLSKLCFEKTSFKKTLDAIIQNRSFFEKFDRYGSWYEASRGFAMRTSRVEENNLQGLPSTVVISKRPSEAGSRSGLRELKAA